MLFGLSEQVAMLILLWPMVRKIFGFDYAGRYSYYNFGGLTLELAAQTLRIGLLNFILIGLGLWFAAKRRLPALPCLAGAELLISLLLFIRVQNSGSHQMLLFLPGWLLLFLIGRCRAGRRPEKAHRRDLKLFYWGFHVVFAVSVRCSPLTTVAMPGFVVDHFPLKAVSEFVRLDKLIYDRNDLPPDQGHCQLDRYPLRRGRDQLHDPPRYAVLPGSFQELPSARNAHQR